VADARGGRADGEGGRGAVRLPSRARDRNLNVSKRLRNDTVPRTGLDVVGGRAADAGKNPEEFRFGPLQGPERRPSWSRILRTGAPEFNAASLDVPSDFLAART